MARNTHVIAMYRVLTLLCIVFFGRGDASGKAVYEPTKATKQ